VLTSFLPLSLPLLLARYPGFQLFALLQSLSEAVPFSHGLEYEAAPAVEMTSARQESMASSADVPMSLAICSTGAVASAP
jgi:hypothetical protein